MKVSVSRKAHFNAAHRLYNPDWPEYKNKEVFDRCANEYFHGHNYELIVTVTGEIDPNTGFVLDVNILKNIIKMRVEDYLDHKNLNVQIPEFKNLNPTAENIVVVIYNRLRDHVPGHLDMEVTLYETPRNFVTYKGI